MKSTSRSMQEQPPKTVTPEGWDGVTREVTGLLGEIRPRPVKKEGWDL